MNSGVCFKAYNQFRSKVSIFVVIRKFKESPAMTYDEFKLQGLEEFAEYRYFKGEAECPYQSGTPEARWWDFEKRFHHSTRKAGNRETFSEYFDEWIRERAAPETGYNLSKGNPWKKEYEENQIFSI
jgi:hypothetical protein